MSGRTALITGANRGIGFETAAALARRGMRVVLTARDPTEGRAAAARVTGDVLVEQLDVASPDSVAACADRLGRAGVSVDVLVNNAGIYPTTPILRVDEATMRAALEVMAIGSWRTARAFMPGMIRRGWGRVVNVSSGGGSMAEGPGPGAYGIAKAALNALTIELAAAAPRTVKVNAVDPGWAATRMGGPAAPRTPAEGADTVVWLAAHPDDGPTGGFFRDRRQIAW